LLRAAMFLCTTPFDTARISSDWATMKAPAVVFVEPKRMEIREMDELHRAIPAFRC